MNDHDFSLPQIQNWMQGMLVQHVAVVGDDMEVNDIVRSSKRLSAVNHLDVYRHSYIARLRACMQTQFSALSYALGAQLFQSFADQYLDANPSGSYTLNTLGEKFADFLQQTRPDAGDEQKETWPDFMIELADFEYSLSVIFDQHAIENNTVPAEDTPDELLKLIPVVRLFKHRFPVCQYYLQFNQGNEPHLPFPEESFCAVTRRDNKLGLFTIKGAQYYFLAAMQQGRSVKEAGDELIKTFHFDKAKFAAIWPAWKKNFITSGFFTAY
jgi:hypothetical protein